MVGCYRTSLGSTTHDLPVRHLQQRYLGAIIQDNEDARQVPSVSGLNLCDLYAELTVCPSRRGPRNEGSDIECQPGKRCDNGSGLGQGAKQRHPLCSPSTKSTSWSTDTAVLLSNRSARTRDIGLPWLTTCAQHVAGSCARDGPILSCSNTSGCTREALVASKPNTPFFPLLSFALLHPWTIGVEVDLRIHIWDFQPFLPFGPLHVIISQIIVI